MIQARVRLNSGISGFGTDEMRPGRAGTGAAQKFPRAQTDTVPFDAIFREGNGVSDLGEAKELHNRAGDNIAGYGFYSSGHCPGR